jgi:hypothetical protein
MSKTDAKRLYELADTIIKHLKQEGFILQRYDAMSTNSIYLKLDYGVCNSIRISDHKGKRHLQYRYNLLLDQKHIERQQTPEGWERFYYGPSQVDTMLKDIVSARLKRLEEYGDSRYKQLMRANQAQGQQSRGFWQQCWEV